jgi:RNA polymerase sigma-70 factor (sigma-E family)
MGAAVKDLDDFRAFVMARGAALSRSAYLLTGDHHLAEDLLQVALSRAAGRWKRIAEGDPEAYIRRTMVHERISIWRRRRYLVEVPTSPDSGPELSRSAPDGTNGVVSRLALERALDRLPPRQRAVIVLRFFDDLTEAATATALGCSVGTVKSQTHDALARLRALAPELLDDMADQEVSR